MRTTGAGVALVLLLAGCHQSGIARNPAFTAPKAPTPTALVIADCENGAPLDGIEASTTEAVVLMREQFKVDASRSRATAEDTAAVCAAFGDASVATWGVGFGGSRGMDKNDWSLSESTRDFVKRTAASAGAGSVLLSVYAYRRVCRHDTATGVDSAGNTVKVVSSHVTCGGLTTLSFRELLFGADGTLLWKMWNAGWNDPKLIDTKLPPMLAQVPADAYVAADGSRAPGTPPVAAAGPNKTPGVNAATAAPIRDADSNDEALSLLSAKAVPACAKYARYVCAVRGLDECKAAVTVSNQPADAPTCTALKKGVVSAQTKTAKTGK